MPVKVEKYSMQPCSVIGTFPFCKAKHNKTGHATKAKQMWNLQVFFFFPFFSNEISTSLSKLKNPTHTYKEMSLEIPIPPPPLLFAKETRSSALAKK